MELLLKNDNWFVRIGGGLALLVLALSGSLNLSGDAVLVSFVVLGGLAIFGTMLRSSDEITSPETNPPQQVPLQQYMQIYQGYQQCRQHLLALDREWHTCQDERQKQRDLRIALQVQCDMYEKFFNKLEVKHVQQDT